MDEVINIKKLIKNFQSLTYSDISKIYVEEKFEEIESEIEDLKWEISDFEKYIGQIENYLELCMEDLGISSQNYNKDTSIDLIKEEIINLKNKLVVCQH